MSNPYPEEDTASSGDLFTPAGRPAANTDLAVPDLAEVQKILGAQAIPFKEWALAVAKGQEFPTEAEEDPGFSIVAAILTARTSAEVFAAMDLKRTEDILDNGPGARTPVMEISGAIPLASTFEEGPGAFSVVKARWLAEAENFTFSVGARAVQAAIMAHMINGWMPFTCVLVRRRTPTRAGYYPLNLEAGG
jgi:hypothetical protein